MAGRGYGMGQYRFNRDYDYITKICDWESGSDKIKYFSKDDFQDVFMILDDDNKKIEYEKSYYLHLEIPQHKEYALTLNLKMGRTVENSDDSPDMNHYQFIRELNILPSPNYSDKKISEKVILYALPSNDGESNNEKITANIIMDDDSRKDELENWIKEISDSSGEKKYYINNEEIDNDKIIKYQIARIDKTWLYENAEDTNITFDLVFSPKFSVSEPYNCLILELQRQSYDNEIQYIDPISGNPHKGVHLNKEKISGELYEIDNLLVSTDANNNNFSPSATINHIAVWSNPEFMFCINGEQIQIGQNNFYELNDFPITFFGVVVRKVDGKNNFDDRFTVDYQYKLS